MGVITPSSRRRCATRSGKLRPRWARDVRADRRLANEPRERTSTRCSSNCAGRPRLVRRRRRASRGRYARGGCCSGAWSSCASGGSLRARPRPDGRGVGVGRAHRGHGRVARGGLGARDLRGQRAPAHEQRASDALAVPTARSVARLHPDGLHERPGRRRRARALAPHRALGLPARGDRGGARAHRRPAPAARVGPPPQRDRGPSVDPGAHADLVRAATPEPPELPASM